jgi:hypothetical protein
MGAAISFMTILVALIAGALALGLLVYFFVVFLRVIGEFVGRLFTFLGHSVRDLTRGIGAFIAAIVISILCVGCIVVGRWSAAAHFGRAVRSESQIGLVRFYQFFVANPLRLLGLQGITEGLDRRLPQIVADAPAPEPSRTARAKFEGYTIVGTLAAGGSGARLYIADPDAMKRAAFERSGLANVGQVVIKSFAMDEGSSLPQIVRESRALDAARRLGLILDHELTPHRFYYVMRYVPGESLTQVTKRLHAMTGPDGLGPREVRSVLSFTADLLATLAAYHRGGLWHKDVKPDNIVVDTRPGGTGRAYLVDFGLLGSLKSAMTLTTHGTEYFRDPELVRLAVKGVKVHEVDGTRFDVYGVGAVLFSMIEDGFPPHGGLSQVTRRCPDAIRWIIRRAMADYDKRYGGAEEMLADVRAALSAEDPFAVKPIDLPSVRGGPSPASAILAGAQARHASPFVANPGANGNAVANSVGHPVGRAVAAGAAVVAQAQPKVRLLNWWTGRSRVELPTADIANPAAAAAVAQQAWIEDRIHQASLAPGVPLQQGARAAMPIRHGATRRSAEAQLAAARERVDNARARAQERAKRLRTAPREADTGPNLGVGIAIAVVAGLAIGTYTLSASRTSVPQQAQVQISAVTLPDVAPGGSIFLTSAPGDPAITYASMEEDAGTTLAHANPRVLVLVDALPPIPGSLSDAAWRVSAAVAGMGAEVVGMGESGDEIEWLSDARAAIGTNPADDPNAAERIRPFFDAHGDAVAVVWMTPDKDRVNARVFVSPAVSSTDAKAIAASIANAMR